MKQIKVIGIGMGDELSMTVAAREWIRECGLWLGAPRMVKTAAAISAPAEKEYKICWQPEDVWDAIRQSRAEKIAVLMSGDTGFFSGAKALRKVIESKCQCKIADIGFCEMVEERDAVNDTVTGKYEISWIPGISSLVYFCNLIGVPYEDVYSLSIHGRSIPYIRQIAVHEKTFLLTGGDLPELGKRLISYGLEAVTVWVGIELSSPNQRVCKMTAQELAAFPQEDCRPLTVCLIENLNAGRWRSPYRRDEEFCRDGKTPMTKEEVRGIILSKLHPGARDVIYDIGGGSGSVSVACAIAASGGMVYSIECEPAAVRLLDQNRHRFACDNIEIIAGRAPEALRGLPLPDRIFIGGSGGDLVSILGEIEGIHGLSKHNSVTEVEITRESNDVSVEETEKVRVVISSITMETNAAVTSYINTSPYVKDAEVCQIAVAKSRKIGENTLMLGQNPVMIFSFDLGMPES